MNGAVEVVFGWPNADNDAFPDVEAPPQDIAWDLLVDTSGGEEKLVVAGFGAAPKDSGRTDNDRYVVRLFAAVGSPDAGFVGGAPFSYHSAQAFDDGGRRASVEPDGSIVSAGYTNLGDTLRNHVILILLNPDGSLDQGFGGFIEPASSGEAVGLTATPGVAILNPSSATAASRNATPPSGSPTAATSPPATVPRPPRARLELRLQDDRGAGRGDLQGGRHRAPPGLGQGRPPGRPERGHRPAHRRRSRPHGPDAARRPDPAGRPLRRIPAAFVFDSFGQLDPTVGEDGILELPHEGLDAQSFVPNSRRTASASP